MSRDLLVTNWYLNVQQTQLLLLTKFDNTLHTCLTVDFLSLILWSRTLLEKLRVTQLVKKFPAFYGTRRFITVFTTIRHWFLSSANWIQSTPSHPVHLRSILILPFHLLLYLTSGLFPTDFTIKILYAFLIYPRRITWATLLLSPNKYKLPISSTLPPLPPSANSGPNSQTPSIPLPKVKTKFHTHTKQIKL